MRMQEANTHTIMSIDDIELFEFLEPLDEIPQQIEELTELIKDSPALPIESGLTVHRITNIRQVLPILNPSLRLINESLPEGYERVEMDFFTRKEVIASSGEVIDLSDQWSGSSFFLLRERGVLGLCIGRRERVYMGGSWKYTNEGYVPLVVGDPEVRGTPLTLLIALMSARSLYLRGVNVINGSCEINNKLVDKIYTKFSKERWVEDEKWVRYIYDNKRVNRLYEKVLSLLGLGVPQIDEFLSTNESE